MALEPEKTVWNPNRYKATEYVITYDTNGNAQLTQKAADYTGVNYNFSSLPSGNTQTTNTQTANTQTGDKQQQTTAAFGDVKPYWWKTESAEGDGSESNVFNQSNMLKPQKDPNVSGFFKPLGDAIEGNKPNLGTRLRHQFADITGKTDREWDQVDKDMRINQIQTDLSSGKLDYEEEQALRTELSDIQQPPFIKRSFDTITKPFKAVKDIGTKAKKGLMDKIYLPGITAAKAIGKIVKRPNANESFRGIPGLYQAEVDNMKKYGSTGPTAGNPTGDPRKDDAGFNIVSWKGNYNAIGTKSRRSNMLKDATKGMTKGSDDWKEARNVARNKWQEEKDWSDTWEREQKDTDRDRTREEKKEQTRKDKLTSQFASEEGASGGSSKIVCTMMNDFYGFGSFRNKIWMKFHKDLSPEYQKGYHKLFLPLVRIAKKNKLVKKVLEHIAVHSTLDMRQSLRGKKHLLGRIYRRIILPICYWAGKK